MRDAAAFKLVTTEVFGPFQVITEYEGGCHSGGLPDGMLGRACVLLLNDS